MRYCDLTFAYTKTSGGIRTYIDQKRRFLAEKTQDEHVLIIPGEDDRTSRNGRLTTVEIAGPMIPGCEPYRFFWRPAAIRHALERTLPDVVELGSFFVSPWPAFRFREERHAGGHACLVSAYFHTDVAHAYVGAPLRKVLAEGVDGFSETLAELGGKLSDLLEGGAEAIFGAVFKKCDLTMAATPKQAARIAEYGVAGTAVVPLGVDLRNFSPERTTPLFRERLGVGAEDVLLIYCGRLDAEKEVTILVDALARLPPQPRFHLAMMGEGPLRGKLQARASILPRLHVLPYESDPRAYAAALASSDIYVTAGPHETFGLAVVEAQACGLPVVGVDAGALRERVLPELGRLGPVGDAQAMAANIVEVAGCRRSMGEAARCHVLTAGYDWDLTFRDLFALYRAAIAQSA